MGVPNFLGCQISCDTGTAVTIFGHFCLGTEVPRHSAGSVGTYDRTAIRRTKGRTLIVFDPFCMLECYRVIAKLLPATKHLEIETTVTLVDRQEARNRRMRTQKERLEQRQRTPQKKKLEETGGRFQTRRERDRVKRQRDQ